MLFCWIVLQFSSRLFKVTYLSQAMCHVLSATASSLTPLFFDTVLLSCTVRILKSSKIHKGDIKYNVRKTVNPILFRLRSFWKCYLTCLNWTYCWSKFKADLNPAGYSLKWLIWRGSTRKGYHFQVLSIWEGWDFTCWRIWKDRENCRFG